MLDLNLNIIISNNMTRGKLTIKFPDAEGSL